MRRHEPAGRFEVQDSFGLVRLSLGLIKQVLVLLSKSWSVKSSLGLVKNLVKEEGHVALLAITGTKSPFVHLQIASWLICRHQRQIDTKPKSLLIVDAPFC